MEDGTWIGLVGIAVPIVALLIYVALRATGRVGKPKGLPPGRRGGAGRIGRFSGVPLSDAPYEDARSQDEEAGSDS